ncbi:hypothetical protein GLOIN_2v1589258 [Rhizophagus irregularis DAOM 181602=DAOM 197198]|nr:hypothetical protein GLOIN_2v1589258 [Rhizophagus irregularis DAOM 181602=DAOM 197198]
MSGICPKFYTGQILHIFWTKSGYVKILGIKFVAKNRHFPDNFWTCQIYSGQFPDIFVDIFRTFIFYRVVLFYTVAWQTPGHSYHLAFPNKHISMIEAQRS